jgi:hypothetical protein
MHPHAMLTRRSRPADLAEIVRRLEDTASGRRIRCPACGWQPGAASRWFCTPTGAPEHFPNGCGTAWNTFDTRGRCPGCDHVWRWTACPSCGAWALHDAWYEPDDGGEE